MTKQSICMTLLVCTTAAALLGLAAGAVWHEALYLLVAGDLAPHLYIDSDCSWLIQKALLAASTSLLFAFLVLLGYMNWARTTWSRRLFGLANVFLWLGASLAGAFALLDYKAALVAHQLEQLRMASGMDGGADGSSISFDVLPVYWLSLIPMLVLLAMWLVRRSKIAKMEKRAAEEAAGTEQTSAIKMNTGGSNGEEWPADEAPDKTWELNEDTQGRPAGERLAEQNLQLSDWDRIQRLKDSLDEAEPPAGDANTDKNKQAD